MVLSIPDVILAVATIATIATGFLLGRVGALKERVVAQAALLRLALAQAGATAQNLDLTPSDYDKWIGQQEQILLSRGVDFCDPDFVRMRSDPDYAAMMRDVHTEDAH